MLPILAVALALVISFGLAAFGCLAVLKVILRITESGSRGRQEVPQTNEGNSEEQRVEEVG